MKSAIKAFLLIVNLAWVAAAAHAEPWLHAGDTLLRHDITMLADAGVITSPISTWPLSVASVDADLQRFTATQNLNQSQLDSLNRLQRKIEREKNLQQTRRTVSGAASREVPLVRSFSDIARSDLEVGASISQLSNRFAFRIDVQLADNAKDAKNVRLDGSYVAGVFGNTIISAGAVDKWWGPGWQGSLIYSNNARPIPGIALQRNFVKPFQSKWLSWMGPWNYMITAGQLESDRVIPNPYHLGMRLTFKPRYNLEIGLSRTAQWGGDGRPTTSDSLLDLLLGQDNRGSDGLDASTEPGNQLAGFDIRWKQGLLPIDLALYAQAIGEDEAGGFPSRYMGLVGMELSQTIFNKNLRVWLEYADTACDFLESKPKLNCAYTHSIYQSGYRHRGESIGHAIDGDGRSLSVAAILSDDSQVDWQLQLHKLNLNRAPDNFHSKSNVPVDGFQFELARTSNNAWGRVRGNIGYQDFDVPRDDVSGLMIGLEFTKHLD
ncbi:MAG: capsule assembly Wzi family protein [Gammaproteobacteria bacterium]|nr:capsule assembly Wzi family protein [Gammaproteobacteria bacterium]NNM13089.1 capsule assembly Wzi family protein [Gammaproteobacteria bacterium]